MFYMNGKVVSEEEFVKGLYPKITQIPKPVKYRWCVECRGNKWFSHTAPCWLVRAILLLVRGERWSKQK